MNRKNDDLGDLTHQPVPLHERITTAALIVLATLIIGAVAPLACGISAGLMDRGYQLGAGRR